MNLELEKWQEFKLGDIFEIRKGKRLTSDDQEEGNNIYIGAIDSNNGVANHIAQNPIHMGNTISLSYNGSVGEAFYQPEPYWATDDVNALYCKYEGFNQYIGLFLATVIRKEKYKFSYGRKWTMENMKITRVNLPVMYENGNVTIDENYTYSEKGYIPDWAFMENYIKSLKYKKLSTKNSEQSVIKVEKWNEFRFGDYINEIYKGKSLNKDDLTKAEALGKHIRYVTRTGEDNGCELLADISNVERNFIEKGNAITIGDTTATCFYQEEQFITGDHMVVVRADWLNKYTGLFIVTLLTNEQYKYSYGRAYLMDRIKDTMLKLPATQKEGKIVPDWEYMENYIKSLPYGDRL